MPIQITNSLYYLSLFILWPFLAFVTAIGNYSQKEARKVVYLFLVYYGLTFVIGDEGLDSFRYALTLRQNAELPFSEALNIIRGFNTSEKSVDFVEPLISFIVSRFTTFHGVLFAAYAALFGFFYVKSISLLHDISEGNRGWNVTIFLAFFVTIIPITAINGVRMYTAAWIFFYGACHVILYRDVRYLFVALCAPLVHFSYLSVCALLVIYYFVGNRNYLYLPLVVLSFFSPQLFSPIFQLAAARLGGAMEARYESYSSEGYIQFMRESAQSSSWFLGLSDDLLFYFILFAIVFIQISSGHFMKGKSERNLFSFTLLFLAFINFGKTIPTFGGRFQAVFYLFAIFYIFMYLRKTSANKINFLTLVGLFPMLLFAAVRFRFSSQTIDAWIFSPGLGLPLMVQDLSLADILFR